MAERVFSNFAITKLASGIGQTDASLALTSGTGSLFPSVTGSGVSAQAASIVLSDGTNTEIMTCTARTGDTLTVTRGSPSYAFLAGTKIMHVCAAADLANFLQKGVSRTVDYGPDGYLEALYFGEEVLNTETKEWWKNTSLDDPTEWRVTGLRGTVYVTISPQEAADAGARWRVNYGDWLESGQYSDNLGTGAVTIDYKETVGYTTPGSVVAGVVSYRTTPVTVTYVPSV